ncbi:hypothetical protein Tco_1310906 [Tanacetum coccineum]
MQEKEKENVVDDDNDDGNNDRNDDGKDDGNVKDDGRKMIKLRSSSSSNTIDLKNLDMKVNNQNFEKNRKDFVILTLNSVNELYLLHIQTQSMALLGQLAMGVDT